MHWANNMFVVTHFDKHGTKEWLTLGKFASADEAARCYDRHVRATDGVKAKLNFPDSVSMTPKGTGKFRLKIMTSCPTLLRLNFKFCIEF